MGPTYSGIVVATGDEGGEFGFSLDALHESTGYEYQSFGVWQAARGTNEGFAHAVTLGLPTITNNIPTQGNFRYDGYTTGAFLDEEGLFYYSTLSELSIQANFAQQTLDVTSENTVMYNMYADRPAAEGSGDGLDFTGTVNLSNTAGSVNWFGREGLIYRGNMTTEDGTNGNLDLVFYGDAAEEVGGVFQGEGAGFSTYIGSFGAKR